MDGVVHRTSAPRCTWAASTSAVKSTSENVLFFQFHPSLCLAPSLSSPNKQAFLVLDNEPAFFYFSSYHFRTFSIAAITLLMSSFALLRVSARTDLPDIAAVGIIFLKLAGSSDTMQTVERTEEPIAPARVDRAARGGGGGRLQLHSEEPSPCWARRRTKRLQAAWCSVLQSSQKT